MTLVLHGGQVWTGDPSRPHATAVAVADGRITAVGSDTEVRAAAGQAAETVDLAGRTVVPGLQDAHIHPVWGAMEALRCDLTGAADAAQCTALVREYAAADPGRPWILGGGWGMDCFPGGWPTKELLDAVVPDRPVFLPNADHHSAWVNSVALERAGIDASTPDPAAGRIERDAAYGPTGVLHEAAMDLVARVLPQNTPEDQRAALVHAQEHLFRYGITGWQDAIVGAYGGAGDTLAAYRRADAEGLLKARVTGALWWDRDRGPEQLDDLLARRGEHGRRFRAGTVKVMQDGVLETGTGALLEPYLDQCGCATGNLGHSNVPAELLTEAVTRLDAAGLPGPLPRDRRPRGPRVSGRGRGCLAGQWSARPTPPHRACATGRRRGHRPVRRAGGGGQHPVPLGDPPSADGRAGRSAAGGGARPAPIPLPCGCSTAAPGSQAAATGR